MSVLTLTQVPIAFCMAFHRRRSSSAARFFAAAASFSASTLRRSRSILRAAFRCSLSAPPHDARHQPNLTHHLMQPSRAEKKAPQKPCLHTLLRFQGGASLNSRSTLTVFHITRWQAVP
jgi:hypothetical protein